MNVMKMAWGIAKEGQSKFGGNVKEYFAASLKLAWKIKKGEVVMHINKKVKVITSSGSRNHKSWVAEIVGTHPKWKFDRKFVNPSDDSWDKTFMLGNGVYNVCDGGTQSFIKVENGNKIELSVDEVEEIFA